MLRILNLRAQCVFIDNSENILSIVKDERKLKLIRLRGSEASNIEVLHDFEGTESLLLTKALDTYFVSIDNKVYMSRDLTEWRKTLQLKNEANIIWHACETQEAIILQE